MNAGQEITYKGSSSFELDRRSELKQRRTRTKGSMEYQGRCILDQQEQQQVLR